MKFYISFGQNHVHKLNGKVIDNDCLLLIHADDHQEARKWAFAEFGTKWSMVYDEKQMKEYLHYFPRGIIHIE